MRYLVTGAAGFIGSHLAEALVARGTTCSASTASRTTTTRALRRRTPPGLDVVELDLLDLTLDELARRRATASSTSPGSPASRSFGTGFDALPHAERRSRRSGCSRPRRATGCGSSSPRRPRSTATPRATRRREDAAPRPLSPYGITKLGVRAPRLRVRRALRASTRSGSATSPSTARGSARTWRSRASLDALADGGTFGLFGDG